MGEVELSCLAYAKMYLHASQFPRCSVNGLLLSSSPAGAAVCITDCVPLLHSHLSLAPITQLALTQVDAWCSQTQQRIVGYYQANACVSDSSPTPCALKIAEKIFEQCNNTVFPFFLMGTFFSLLQLMTCVFLRIMLRQWEETCSIVNQLFSSGDQTLLVDFDSHLDDITKDWTNQKLNAKIMELISPANGNV
uniref:ER membrane protein complex subunit 9-like n=1 Tax=Sinocyclocheilus anshuiensis TaxID=1608454 RepID=A0A671MQ34_9TELE